MGDRCTTEGYAKEIAPLDKNPLMLFTKSVGAGNASYYSDYYYYQPTGEILFVGGRWTDGTSAGLWYWDGGSGVSYASSTLAVAFAKSLFKRGDCQGGTLPLDHITMTT